MAQVKLAVIQFPRQTFELDPNIRRMSDYLAAIETDTDIVLLPEGWMGPLFMGEDKNLKILGELFPLIKAPDCLLATGAQYLEIDGQKLDRGFFISKHLDEPVPYDKIFPSQAIRERDFIVPGHHLPVVEHQGVKVGAAVCVDFFYPELVRSLALRGASLVVNPANIPTNRMPLWHRLGVTRASENTVFVAMANNTGTSYPDQRRITGDSFVAYPDGFQLFTFGPEPGIYYHQLDLSLIDQVRQRWPYLDDIRERGMEVPR
ncbi:MAG: carbon-nitrogen hydrolase family protein [Firmicutes bacterium]|nr:carbon-nitrogen hydrolase family protein [Bacillota bacterium]